MKRDVTQPARHARDRRDLAARGRAASASRWRARSDAYATSDGRGGIAIGATETLDGDDALAQLVFHELCHAITEGEASLATARLGARQRPRARRARARVPARAGARRRSLRPARRDGADDAVPRVLRRRCPPIRWHGAADRRATRSRARPRRARASTRRRGARRSSRRWRRRRPRSDARQATRPRRTRSASRSGRRPRPAARAPGSTTAGAARGRALPAERARRTATARARRAATRRARTGSRPSTAAPAARAAARPIIRSPCRCAIRWSGRSRT